jgi:mannose-1-phosphate guanylyltransferase/phosphomannomutase
MRRLVDTYRSERLDLTDGLKVDIDGGWVLVVPDPDRPSYRVIVSVASETAAQRELASFVRAVSETVERSAGGAPAHPVPPGSSPAAEQLPA